VASLLELTQQTFGCKLTLEVFDCTLHTLAVNNDLEWLTLNCFARVRQGTRRVPETKVPCNRRVHQFGQKSALRPQFLTILTRESALSLAVESGHTTIVGFSECQPPLLVHCRQLPHDTCSRERSYGKQQHARTGEPEQQREGQSETYD
jgi:hypothetical protein